MLNISMPKNPGYIVGLVSPDRTIKIEGILTIKLAKEVIEKISFLEKSKDDIKIILNSKGGHFDAGMDLYNRFDKSPNKIIGIVNGSAYSAAFMALQGCHERMATEESRLLIHNAEMVDLNSPFIKYNTTEEEYLKETKKRFLILSSILQQAREDTIKILLKKSAFRERKELENFLDVNYKMTPMEAISLGFLDKIV